MAEITTLTSIRRFGIPLEGDAPGAKPLILVVVDVPSVTSGDSIPAESLSVSRVEAVLGAVCTSTNAALTHASVTLTFSGGTSQGETITIDGETYTYKNIPGSQNEIGANGSATTSAEWLVRHIRYSWGDTNTASTFTNIRGRLLADQSGAGADTVVLRAVEAGSAGNGIPISTTAANISLSGATTSGGVSPTGAPAVSPNSPGLGDITITHGHDSTLGVQITLLARSL